MGGGEILKKGWLVKSPPLEGGGMKSWRKRWFCLRSSKILEYYKSENGDIKGVVNLEDCVSIHSALFHKKYKHVFDIQTRDRTYFLVASSQEEMVLWVKSLCSVCSFITQEPVPNPSKRNSSTLPGNFPIQPPAHTTAGVPFTEKFGTTPHTNDIDAKYFLSSEVVDLLRHKPPKEVASGTPFTEALAQKGYTGSNKTMSTLRTSTGSSIDSPILSQRSSHDQETLTGYSPHLMDTQGLCENPYDVPKNNSPAFLETCVDIPGHYDVPRSWILKTEGICPLLNPTSSTQRAQLLANHYMVPRLARGSLTLRQNYDQPIARRHSDVSDTHRCDHPPHPRPEDLYDHPPPPRPVDIYDHPPPPRPVDVYDHPPPPRPEDVYDHPPPPRPVDVYDHPPPPRPVDVYDHPPPPRPVDVYDHPPPPRPVDVYDHPPPPRPVDVYDHPPLPRPVDVYDRLPPPRPVDIYDRPPPPRPVDILQPLDTSNTSLQSMNTSDCHPLPCPLHPSDEEMIPNKMYDMIWKSIDGFKVLDHCEQNQVIDQTLYTGDSSNHISQDDQVFKFPPHDSTDSGREYVNLEVLQENIPPVIDRSTKPSAPPKVDRSVKPTRCTNDDSIHQISESPNDVHSHNGSVSDEPFSPQEAPRLTSHSLHYTQVTFDRRRPVPTPRTNTTPTKISPQKRVNYSDIDLLATECRLQKIEIDDKKDELDDEGQSKDMCNFNNSTLESAS